MAWKKGKTKNGLDCDNEAKLENLRKNYVNKRNICNRANRNAIKIFKQQLSRDVKKHSKSFYNYFRNKREGNEKA